MRKVWVVLLGIVVVGVVACSGDLGESCDEEGKVSGECSDDLVCGKKQADSADLVCLKQCSSAADCSGTEDCLGVANSSLKGCRTRR